MSKFVMLVPSRSRPQNVAPILEAWKTTRADPVAELVFVLDKDDPTLPWYELALDGSRLNVMFLPMWQPMVPKLNWAASVVARWSGVGAVGFMGDDHLPRTHGWASALLSVHRDAGRHVVYGKDGYQDQKLPTWWSMSSAAIRALGRMVPAPVQHLYCDNAVMELGREADSLYYCPDVLIEHMHPLAGKGKMDEQYRRVNRPQQYYNDRIAFQRWMAEGLAGDAKIVRNLGR